MIQTKRHTNYYIKWQHCVAVACAEGEYSVLKQLAVDSKQSKVK